MLQQRARTFTTFGILIGVAGLATVVWSLVRSAPPSWGALAEAGLVAILSSLSWRLSIPLLSQTRFSLDLSYMTMALLLYPAPLPVLVGAGTAALGTLLKGRGETSNGSSPLRALSFMMVNCGSLVLMMAAGERLVAGWGLGAGYPPGLSIRLLLDVAVIFLVLTGINICLMAVAVRLRGESLADYLIHHARHVLPLEMYNVPLAVLMIVTRSTIGLGAFALLSATTLVASLLLKSLHATQEELRRSNQELALKADELSALNSIGREILSSLDPGRVLRTVHEQAARLMEAGIFSVALYDRERSVVRHVYAAGHGPEAETRSSPVGHDLFSWVVKSGRPVHVSDTAVDADRPFDLAGMDASLRSILAIPMTQPGGDVMGVLAVGSRRPDVYSERHLGMLASIAQHAAIALENARYYELATVDQGTRLYLKDYFHQRLEEEMARARRYGRQFSILMLDLDGFKQINDEFGHQAGDRFLRKVGDVIRSSLRSTDIASRYGGEEFAVLLPETEHPEGVVLAERIRRHVAEIRLHEEGRRFGTTISIGIASYPKSARRDPEDLIRKADLALYQAKREGKDRVVSAA